MGHLLDKEKMHSHLKKEEERNGTPYGLRVVTISQKTKASTKIIRRKRGTVSKDILNDLDDFFTEATKLEKQSVKHQEKLTGSARKSGIVGKKRTPDRIRVNLLDSANRSGKKENVSLTPEVGLSRVQTSRKEKSHIERRLPKVKEKARKLMVKGVVVRTAGARNKTSAVDSAKPKEILTGSVNILINGTTRNKTSKGLLVKYSKQKKSKSSPVDHVTQNKLPHKNCFSLEEKSKFNSVWMGSDSDWTTLQIYLGKVPDEALEQAEKALEHYRIGLRDLWNIHGLTAGQGYGLDGQPWCTSHYTFHMVLWHIPLALSGQRYSALEKSLHFEPRLKIPYALPFFTPFGSGMVESKIHEEKVEYKVSLTSGELVLKLLTVGNSKFPRDTIRLRKDEYVKWTRA